jgi:protocatechuate 3,4-dioxygenase beta subunit
MKPLHAAAVLLLALALGAWFLLSPPSAPAPVEVPTPAANSAAEKPAAGVLDPALTPPAAPSGIESRETVVPELAAAAAGPAYATPAPEGEGFLVRAVETESKKPIPFAEILFVDVGQLDQQAVQARMAELRDIDALIEALATRYRTGADGTVRLPLPTQEVWAAARKDSWFGLAMENSIPKEGMTIECQLSKSVSARVVDEKGSPQASVPVDLRIGDENRSDRVISILTGEDGIARIRRLEMFQRDTSGSARFSVAIGGPLGATVEQVFDVEALPAEPLLLVLPPSGRIEVRVSDASGQPWATAAIVQLTIVDPAAAVNGVIEMRGEGSTALVSEGLATFTPAGLGRQFQARASRTDGSLIGDVAGFGPVSAGETARLEIVERAGNSFIVGRIVGSDGQPVTSARLEIGVEVNAGGGRSSNNDNFRTDAAGRFRILIENPILPEGAKRTATVRQRQRGASAAAARVDLSWTLPPGDVDLGDLRLALAPMVAAGIVVDEAGEPVANAHVTLQEKHSYGEGASEFYWSWIQGGEVFTGADGSFVLNAEVESGEFLLSCMSSDYWCEGVIIRPGATGMQLVLRRGGSLNGTLLTDEGADLKDILIELTDPSAPPDPFGRGTTQVQSSGKFEYRVLRPGTYNLRLRLGSSDHVFLELAGLMVTAGEVCADPRLNPLDARGLIRSLLIRAVDADGKKISQFSVFRIKPGGEMDNFYAHDGELRLPHEGAPVDLILQSDGFLRTRLQGVTSDQTVTLRRAPRVRIQITNPGVIPAGFEVMVRVDPVADRDQQIWSDSHGTMGADGWAECSAVATGASSVQVVLMLRTASGSRGWGIRNSLGEIDVRDTGGVQTFQVTLEEQEVAETVARLQKDS